MRFTIKQFLTSSDRIIIGFLIGCINVLISLPVVWRVIDCFLQGSVVRSLTIQCILDRLDCSGNVNLTVSLTGLLFIQDLLTGGYGIVIGLLIRGVQVGFRLLVRWRIINCLLQVIVVRGLTIQCILDRLDCSVNLCLTVSLTGLLFIQDLLTGSYGIVIGLLIRGVQVGFRLLVRWRIINCLLQVIVVRGLTIQCILDRLDCSVNLCLTVSLTGLLFIQDLLTGSYGIVIGLLIRGVQVGFRLLVRWRVSNGFLQVFVTRLRTIQCILDRLNCGINISLTIYAT